MRRVAIAARALTLLTSLLVCLSQVGAAAKSRAGVTAKHAQFLSQAHSSSHRILDLKGADDFDSLIASPRNYSVSMLLTAVDSGVQCGPCLAFQPTYESLSRSYGSLKGSAPYRHLFSVLEFKNGREIFQKLQLQYAPVLLFFPATSGPHAAPSAEPVTFDFNRLGFEGKDVAEELSKQLGIRVPFSKPIQWRLIGSVALSTLAIMTVLVTIVPKLVASPSMGLSMIGSMACQAVILVIIVIMCAGQMWNSIRNAPYMAMGADGKPEYFAGGFQNQYGAETHIVAAVYAILGFSTISLVVLVPMQRDPVKQRAGVYVWSAILLAAFSLLIYIFRIKNPSYPFRLFF